MISLLKSWQGTFVINNNSYDSLNKLNLADIVRNGEINIKLLPKEKVADNANMVKLEPTSNFAIVTVKKYMTKKSTPSFEFMKKWNNDIPMPSIRMRGEKLQETRGMIKMKLEDDEGNKWVGWIIKSAIIEYEECKSI